MKTSILLVVAASLLAAPSLAQSMEPETTAAAEAETTTPSSVATATSETVTTSSSEATSESSAPSSEASSETSSPSSEATSDVAAPSSEAPSETSPSSEATSDAAAPSSEAPSEPSAASSEASSETSAPSSEATSEATAPSSEAATTSPEVPSTEATSPATSPEDAAKPTLSTPDLIRAMQALVTGNFVDSPMDPHFAAASDVATAAVAPPQIEEDPEVAAANEAFLVAYEAALRRGPIPDSPVVARAKALHLAVLEKALADAAADVAAAGGTPAASEGVAVKTAPAPSSFPQQGRGGFAYSTVSHHAPFVGFPGPAVSYTAVSQPLTGGFKGYSFSFHNPYVFNHPATSRFALY